MDANVSIRSAGEATLGTKTELKNMNSFRFLERGSPPRSSARSRSCATAARWSKRRFTSIPRPVA